MKKTLLNRVLSLCLAMMGVSATAIVTALPMTAQEQKIITISGQVTDPTGEPMIGATVMVKGTTIGAVTDIDGNYRIANVPIGSTLTVNYVGYNAIDVKVGANPVINLVLTEDVASLDEVVVVGYGVQKKKLVTGATVQMKGDAVAKMNTTSALGAMQSMTPGISIVADNSQPGEGFKVNIRGLGTVGDSQPLYVIDGVAGSDINTLNPSDIESIDVLKDAASAAIYGSRAANGVILVTTKQGKEGKTSVTYDGYIGWQNVYKMPHLLNAQETIAMTNETNFNNGAAATQWESVLGSKVYDMIKKGWEGTNWLELSRNKNASVQNHAINITGGGARSQYSAGLSYTNQDGIIGAPTTPHYKRYTARMNSNHTIWTHNDRDIVKWGENITFYYSTRNGIAQTMAEYNDVRSLINTTPLLPAYNDSGDLYTQADKTADGWVYDNNVGNPLLVMKKAHGQNQTKNYGLNATAYINIEPIKGLLYNGSISYRLRAEQYRDLTTPYAASANLSSTSYIVNQESFIGHEFSAQHTLSYTLPLPKKFNADVLIGQSIERRTVGDYLKVKNSALEGEQLPSMKDDLDHAWISNTNNSLTGTKIQGYPVDEWSLASFFGRANFNYDEKYLATFVLRADGSSNFARGHRWGYFPSVSAGWVMTSEKFMKPALAWLDFLKLRVSWGKNGNQSIENFQYVSPIAFDPSHVYGFGQTVVNTSGTKSPGAYAVTLANEDVSWEKSEQWDFGIDARFLNSRLGVAFDYYIKQTKDWLVQAPILATAGTGAPFINGGDVKNTGVELGLNWNDRINRDFNYGVNVNFTYNKNEVTNIANTEGIIHGDNLALGNDAAINEFYRAQVGYPIGYFWGYETDGIFQNQAEIDAWRNAGNGIAQTNPQPGDIRFVDRDHNGVIDEKDKTMIGDPTPDFRLGLSFNIQWKGFDLAVTTSGAFGHQLVYAYRSAKTGFVTTDALGRWHGEGTSNRYPRLGNGTSIPGSIDETWIEDGDYWRIQNVTLGYDFKHLLPNLPMQQLRLYISGQNLYTFTSYKGMDPEVGFGGADLQGNKTSWVNGVDLGSYPLARTIILGLNLKF